MNFQKHSGAIALLAAMCIFAGRMNFRIGSERAKYE
jgi:hypothetical protein